MNENVVFKAEKISKSYNGIKVVDNISIHINKGEIVGLIGENGAGKSTFLKIIMGVEKADSGIMSMNGNNYAPQTPKIGNESGVGMVFQEQSLILNLSVAQNIFFGEENKYRKKGFINWRNMDKAAQEILNNISLQEIPSNKKVENIQFSKRQMIEIAKVFSKTSKNNNKPSLVLLDEPTSVLNGEEIKLLFEKIKIIKKLGHSIIFVSHRLNEVLEISDRIYVFKNGKNIFCDVKEDLCENILYEKMVGRSSSQEYYKINKQTQPKENVLIEANNLGLFGYFKGVSFDLHEGEIISLCGVVGSGKERVCDVLTGMEKYTSGELKVSGRIVNFSNPYKALKAGIVCIPSERRTEGQVGITSIRENITYSSLKSITKLGLISRKKEKQIANKWIEDLSIKCNEQNQILDTLSGGNVQKVIFARALLSDSKVVILNHPTRGIDVGAKEDIYNIIRSATEKGVGIILIGDTLEESIGLSNKIIVMKDGIVTKIFVGSPKNKPKPVEIVRYML